MKFRQAVITIERPAGAQVSKALMYRQPFNKLGLDFNFSFSKSYGEIHSNVEVEIFNAAPETVELFNFNPRDFQNRPLVRIYAGYSNVLCRKYDDWRKLKNSLPLIFSGYPFFVADKNFANGRTLRLQLTDRTVLAQETQARYVGSFQAGTSVQTILQTLSRHSQQNYDLSRVGFLGSVQIENSLFFSGQNIIAYILPLLAGRFNFTFSISPSGSVVFSALENAPRAATVEVSIDTGLVEQPERQNWTQWSFRTLFGLPAVFFPGDWVRLKSDAIKGFGVSSRGVVTGLIVDANYSFAQEAYIDYTLATDGLPTGSSVPVLEV